jgi:hypothetical protein
MDVNEMKSILNKDYSDMHDSDIYDSDNESNDLNTNEPNKSPIQIQKLAFEPKLFYFNKITKENKFVIKANYFMVWNALPKKTINNYLDIMAEEKIKTFDKIKKQLVLDDYKNKKCIIFFRNNKVANKIITIKAETGSKLSGVQFTNKLEEELPMFHDFLFLSDIMEVALTVEK